LGHFLESLALAGVLAFAGILRALAGRLALTRIHSVTMHLGFIGAGGGERSDTEQKRGGCGERGARDGPGHLHLKLLLMFKIADEGLNKVSHLTLDKTAAWKRLLQDDAKSSLRQRCMIVAALEP
jgi:hypothetical protein